MATTNATISINSDISSYPVRINSSMTMKKAGSCHGLDETNGLRSKKFTGTSAAIIIEAAEYTADKAHKVYIRNTASNKEYFFYVAYNASAAAATTDEVIGKLYGGDWMLMPYDGAVNITVASSTTETQILEYMVFADVLVDQTS
jgi:hypothetical protein